MNIKAGPVGNINFILTLFFSQSAQIPTPTKLIASSVPLPHDDAWLWYHYYKLFIFYIYMIS